MKEPWFKPWKWIYQPTVWQGWAVTAVAGVFCLHIFSAVERNSNSASDTFYGIFPYWVPTFLLWYWVASKTSSKE